MTTPLCCKFWESIYVRVRTCVCMFGCVFWEPSFVYVCVYCVCVFSFEDMCMCITVCVYFGDLCMRAEARDVTGLGLLATSQPSAAKAAAGALGG